MLAIISVVINSITRTSPKLHRNFPETKVHDLSTTCLRLVSGKFRGNEPTDLSRGSFGESNELDMLSSLACLGEVCDKSTTSLGEVRVMEFDNEHDKGTLAAPTCLGEVSVLSKTSPRLSVKFRGSRGRLGEV